MVSHHKTVFVGFMTNWAMIDGSCVRGRGVRIPMERLGSPDYLKSFLSLISTLIHFLIHCILHMIHTKHTLLLFHPPPLTAPIL